MISKNQVRRAAKRIANGDLDDANISVIESYRSSFDDLLVNASNIINRTLVGLSVPFLVSGRPKRTSSIVRKLIRERHMDAANMADLVGVRVVVSDVAAQDLVTDVLRKKVGESSQVRDYRTRETGYRCVHLISRVKSKRLEIQIRTLSQHVWAVESESFGKTVKEGGGDTLVRTYLDDELGPACKAIDEGNVPRLHSGLLWEQRNPVSRFLPNLRALFHQATEGFSKPRPDTAYIVVFDTRLSFLTRVDVFRDQRETAVAEYNRLATRLDGERFEVLILNSRTPQAISVTHPNFFPKVKFGKFDDLVERL